MNFVCFFDCHFYTCFIPPYTVNFNIPSNDIWKKKSEMQINFINQGKLVISYIIFLFILAFLKFLVSNIIQGYSKRFP